MFDDLRSIADNSSDFPDQSDTDLEPLLGKGSGGKGGSKKGKMPLFGLSAFQRFVLSALLFFLVCILGVMLVMINSSLLVF